VSVRIPKPGSAGEELFALHCRANQLPPPEREFKFANERLWRIDFAWPQYTVAVEIEGAVHRIRARFAGDLEKYNAMTLLGWCLLRYDHKAVKSGRAIAETQALLLARSQLISRVQGLEELAKRVGNPQAVPADCNVIPMKPH
jgi:very-short-patch-repair endonuclease